MTLPGFRFKGIDNGKAQLKGTPKGKEKSLELEKGEVYEGHQVVHVANSCVVFRKLGSKKTLTLINENLHLYY